MAWKYPKHICGHEGPRYQSYGHYERRNRRHAAIESRPCPDCLAKAAGVKAKEAGLPVLKGSPKQIAWASDIRECLLKAWTEEIEGAEKLLDEVQKSNLAKAKQVVEGAKKRLAERSAQAEARWWIEHQESRGPLDEEVRERIAVRLKLVKALT